MKIFVTGATGLLGSNLVRELIKRGHELRVLTRPSSNLSTLEGLALEKVTGDLLDCNSLRKAAGDAEAIFHLAANTNIWPSRSEMVNLVNIEGTRNIICLAEELGIKRLVHVGTANSFGYGTKENPGNEDKEYMGLKYGIDYMDSKWRAQQLVINAVRDGLPALIVNPTFMVGAYDSAPNAGAMILAVHSQKLPGYSPGGRNFICVEDAAIGVANALDKGNIGESYIIGNENLSYKEVFRKIASVVGVEAPKRRIPKLGVLAFGMYGSLMYRITGRKPLVSYSMAKQSCEGFYYSSEKAIRELDLPQTKIEYGIQSSFDWLNANGYV